MDTFLAWLSVLFPWFALVGALLSLALGLSVTGQRLRRHADWLRLLDQRVHNLHSEKREAYKRSLRSPLGSVRLPPPLSEAKTTDISDEMLETLKLRTREGDDGKPKPEE